MPNRHKRCSITGCEQLAHGQGFCGTHLYRYKKHGDPLKLAKPRGVGLRWLSDVALDYSGNDCLMWPFNKSGYGTVSYQGRNTRPSRVVCFLKFGAPPSPSHEAAHSCGQGHHGCVNPKHLRWATPTENQKDKLSHGTSNRGRSKKISEQDAIWIRSVAGRIPQQDIADKFGLTQSTISNIQTGRRWAWLDEQKE